MFNANAFQIENRFIINIYIAQKMTKFIKLKPHRINENNSSKIAYINPENITTIYEIDDRFTRINMINKDVITVEINIDKLIENLRND